MVHCSYCTFLCMAGETIPIYCVTYPSHPCRIPYLLRLFIIPDDTAAAPGGLIMLSLPRIIFLPENVLLVTIMNWCLLCFVLLLVSFYLGILYAPFLLSIFLIFPHGSFESVSGVGGGGGVFCQSHL